MSLFCRLMRRPTKNIALKRSKELLESKGTCLVKPGVRGTPTVFSYKLFIKEPLQTETTDWVKITAFNFSEDFNAKLLTF